LKRSEIIIPRLTYVVQAIPTFEALRNHYPAAHISWLVEEEAADLLQYYPGLDEIMICRRRSWLKELRNPLLWPKVSLDILRFCGRLRQRYYDVIWLGEAARSVLTALGRQAGGLSTKDFHPMTRTGTPWSDIWMWHAISGQRWKTL
jgi:hypothetical protein